MDKATLDNLLKGAKAANQQDRKRADAFASMLKMEGWSLFVELLNERLQMFSSELLQPLSSHDETLRQEFVKGAMFAFVLMRDLPSVTIASVSSSGDEEN